MKYPTYTKRVLVFCCDTAKCGTVEALGMQRGSRSLKFVFQFPPIHGVFDAGYGVVYVFGGMHESEIESVLSHETMHYVLLHVAGKKASLKLDRIYADLEKFESET